MDSNNIIFQVRRKVQISEKESGPYLHANIFDFNFLIITMSGKFQFMPMINGHTSCLVGKLVALSKKYKHFHESMSDYIP